MKQDDLNNVFVDTPESDIPETLRDTIFLDAKKDPAFKRLGQYFDIEIQGRSHGSFYDRAVLYAGIVAAEAHGDALRAYDKAKKTLGKAARYKMPHIICIWLCDFPKENNGEEISAISGIPKEQLRSKDI